MLPRSRLSLCQFIILRENFRIATGLAKHKACLASVVEIENRRPRGHGMCSIERMLQQSAMMLRLVANLVSFRSGSQRRRGGTGRRAGLKIHGYAR
jgi:hypothetical protein